jgi:small subunit ribosomal protein S7
MNNKEILKKLTNLIMRDGKKSLASKLLNLGMNLASKELNLTEAQLLENCLNKIRPSVNARVKKVGSSSYIVPYAITEDQSINLALKIFVKIVRERKEKTFVDCLANEFIDVCNDRGATIKRKNEIHKLAEANKSFAYFR